MKVKLVVVAVAAFALAACGGGGGSRDSGAGVASSGAGNGTTSGGTTTNQPPSQPSSDLIRGTITGFGSVFIDGQRFDTADATFTKDDQPATQDDLNIGMVVELRGDVASGTASSVDFEEDVKGPIDAISPTLDQLTVLGQTIVITPETVLDDGMDLSSLVVGDILEISGLRGENDQLEASFLEGKLLAEVNAFKVIGQVRELNSTAQTFRIGGLSIGYSTALLDDNVNLADGATVEVKDESKAYSPGDFSMIASKIEPAGLGQGIAQGSQNDDDNAPNFGRVQVEGLISEVINAEQFALGNTIVNYTTSTQFVFGTASLLTVGTKVQVEGTLDDNGTITASKIKFSRNSARIHGMVEVVNSSTEQLSILGVVVNLSGVEEFEDQRDDVEPFGIADLRIGDFLEIRGNSNGDVVIANEVEREDDDDTRLRGPADNVDASARTLSILGVTITTSSTTRYEGFNDEVISAEVFFSTIANGQTLVDAQWDGVVIDPAVAVRELSLED